MKKALPIKIALCAVLISTAAFSQKKKETATSKSNVLNADVLNELTFRSIGPAVTSGRIVDFAVNPTNSKEYYVAAAAGGVWKTTNSGITYDPVFEHEGSYSIGCVEIDPNNTNVVWVGSGENNNQRSVSYGDGVYKSEDGGKSWKNMGLKTSEHIGMIAIDPKNSNIVYVAAYGPVWSAGGERGIYKTTDGGKTWNRILNVSENTGFNEVHLDPRNSDVIYATAHQRRRQGFTYISGGPESMLYRSTNGGTTWDTLSNGLPSGDKGRIGLAISPVNPDYVYAIIEATAGKGGVYLSTDRGASFNKMSGNATAGNYYGEIFCDPKDVDKVYYVDFWIMVSLDGGRTFNKIGEKYKHVDNHALWIDPRDGQHIIAGCDGGVYETYDNGSNWNFKSNLPVTQFYKVAVDNAEPFYNVYGGTQDNNSLGGPSRTKSGNGIVNADWFVTQGGDGFESQIDPKDPNIVYAQSQYGGLGRFDKKSGEVVDIIPVQNENEPAMRWNWDAPLLISNFSNTRLYFGSNKLFRSDNRGDSWTPISGDLSRQIDRNKLPVMGKVWSVDAIAKNASTDFYGNLVTIAESYFDENNLVVGTDDGLIQVTTDGGKSWKAVDNIAGVPERTYVNQIIASQHDKNTFYATFNHHRYGDFKPYVFKSTNGGLNWTAIQNDLPVRGSAYTIAEDHVNKDLLFVGTEFGVFYSNNGGKNWIQLKGGLPTIAIRDIAIQKRENDLVLATFGRGFYILDDYTPLRAINDSVLNKAAYIAPIKDSWMFIESNPVGAPLKGFQGESYFSVANPQVGSTFTYFLKDDIQTIKEKRQAAEKEKIKKNEPVYYPSIDSLRLEDNQPAPYILFTITDPTGGVVRKMKAPAKKGLHRIVWNFRYAAAGPVDFHTPDPTNPYDQPALGFLAMPGMYNVAMSKFEDGVETTLVAPQPFVIKALNAATLGATDKKSLDVFCKKASELYRATSAADAYRNELQDKLKYIKAAIVDMPAVNPALHNQIRSVESKLNDINTQLNGDATKAKREFETTPSINGRIGNILYTCITSTSAPTETAKQSYTVASKQFTALLPQLGAVDSEIKNIDMQLEQMKAPYTPGRMPIWNER